MATGRTAKTTNEPKPQRRVAQRVPVAGSAESIDKRVGLT